MPRTLHRLVALCLVLLWGPATMCCTLEAAGWKASCSESSCSHDEQEKIPDNCGLIESGQYQSSVPSVKIEPPASTVCACFICARELAEALRPREAMVDVETDHSRDWVPIWQFERRAAAPANAPDSLIT